MSPRPPAPIRYLVLVVALLSLIFVMCAHSRPKSDEPANPAAVPTADAGPTGAKPANPQAQTPPGQNPPDREFFPATKAPGGLYPQNGH